MPAQKSGQGFEVSMHSARPTAHCPLARSRPQAHSAVLVQGFEQAGTSAASTGPGAAAAAASGPVSLPQATPPTAAGTAAIATATPIDPMRTGIDTVLYPPSTRPTSSRTSAEAALLCSRMVLARGPSSTLIE